MTNKFLPHVFVLPEDDANRQIANGFIINPGLNEKAIQILPPAGGWAKVIDAFKDNHIHKLQDYPERRIVLVIDFDNRLERLDYIKCQIPEELTDRVFILGVLSTPEKLKASLNYEGLEDIGKSLFQDCSNNEQKTWGHELLKHNKAEIDRLILLFKPFLFE